MKITDIEINENNVKSAPDTLVAEGEKSTNDIKHIFDKLPELIAEKHNALVDYMTGELCSKAEMKDMVVQEISNTGADDIARQIYDSDNDGMVDSASNGVFEYVHTAGSLQGKGINGKFKAAVSETVTKLDVNGEEYAVKCSEDDEIDLIEGRWYSFVLDTEAKTVNFKAGGGLSGKKLALAAAATGDVLSGKTFYSGNKELKTGDLITHYHESRLVYTTSNRIMLPRGNYRLFYLNLYTWHHSGILNGAKVYLDGSVINTITGPDIQNPQDAEWKGKVIYQIYDFYNPKESEFYIDTTDFGMWDTRGYYTLVRVS